MFNSLQAEMYRSNSLAFVPLYLQQASPLDVVPFSGGLLLVYAKVFSKNFCVTRTRSFSMFSNWQCLLVLTLTPERQSFPFHDGLCPPTIKTN